MRFFLRFLCVVAMLVGGWEAQADQGAGPVYQRTRSGVWGSPSMQYGSSMHNGDDSGGMHPVGHGGGYWQQSYGNWFTRPYPYHFDYYRWRYSTPPANARAPDCPCAFETASPP